MDEQVSGKHYLIKLYIPLRRYLGFYVYIVEVGRYIEQCKQRIVYEPTKTYNTLLKLCCVCTHHIFFSQRVMARTGWVNVGECLKSIASFTYHFTSKSRTQRHAYNNKWPSETNPDHQRCFRFPLNVIKIETTCLDRTVTHNSFWLLQGDLLIASAVFVQLKGYRKYPLNGTNKTVLQCWKQNINFQKINSRINTIWCF